MSNNSKYSKPPVDERFDQGEKYGVLPSEGMLYYFFNLDGLNLSPTAYLLLTFLLVLSGSAKTSINFSNKYLSIVLNKSIPTISKALTELKKTELITVKVHRQSTGVSYNQPLREIRVNPVMCYGSTSFRQEQNQELKELLIKAGCKEKENKNKGNKINTTPD